MIYELLDIQDALYFGKPKLQITELRHIVTTAMRAIWRDIKTQTTPEAKTAYYESAIFDFAEMYLRISAMRRIDPDPPFIDTDGEGNEIIFAPSLDPDQQYWQEINDLLCNEFIKFVENAEAVKIRTRPKYLDNICVNECKIIDILNDMNLRPLENIRKRIEARSLMQIGIAPQPQQPRTANAPKGNRATRPSTIPAPDDGEAQELATDEANTADGMSCPPSTGASAGEASALAEIEPADISLPVESWVKARDILNKATRAGYFTATPQKYVWKATNLPANVLAYLCLCLYYEGTDTDVKIIAKPLDDGTGDAFARYFDNVPKLATAIKNTKTALARKKELSRHQLSIKNLFA